MVNVPSKLCSISWPRNVGWSELLEELTSLEKVNRIHPMSPPTIFGWRGFSFFSSLCIRRGMGEIRPSLIRNV